MNSMTTSICVSDTTPTSLELAKAVIAEHAARNHKHETKPEEKSSDVLDAGIWGWMGAIL